MMCAGRRGDVMKGVLCSGQFPWVIGNLILGALEVMSVTRGIIL